MNKNPQMTKTNRRRWPVVKPCDCPSCRRVRAQIVRIKNQSPPN